LILLILLPCRDSVDVQSSLLNVEFPRLRISCNLGLSSDLISMASGKGSEATTTTMFLVWKKENLVRKEG